MNGAFDMLEFGGPRRVPYIQQSEASECALACLAMVACYHGYKTDLNVLRQRFSLSLKGATLKQIMAVAEAIGFTARPLRGEPDDLSHLALPAIIHWNLNHFVVLTKITKGISGTRYHIHDPSRAVTVIDRDELSRHFTGVIVELIKAESFQLTTEKTKLRISHLWTSMSGFWSTVHQVVLLTLVLQFVVLAAPFYMQLAVDTVLPSSDRDLLKVLALGFAGLSFVSFLTGWLRSLVVIRFNSALAYQIIVNLFRHLVRLPLPWFEKRHIGDIVSRFGSTKPITDLLSQGMVTGFIDGIMALITVSLMFLYSTVLAIISIVALMTYAGLRFAYLHSLRLRNLSVITANARENSLFIESVRGIAAIKAFGQEANRQRVWQRAKADAVNAQIKLGRMSAGFDATNQLVISLERVLFVYFAIGYVISGKMTIGMVFALQAYKEQFVGSGTRLIEQVMNWKVLQLHLGRLVDIVTSPIEPASTATQLVTDCIDGGRTPSIELRDVRFAYAPGEPETIKGINLTIEPGDRIVLVGPSGGGKTTLLKIMIGLFDPTYGEVFIDGVPLTIYGKSRWRKQIGYIAQDDALFAGSLADNISFFDSNADLAQIVRVAEQAGIASTINSMPMRYETLVGDMGSALSGGQKQRVLLARALYSMPNFLFMDEGTAHLDGKSENAVLKAMETIPLTRVTVTHRRSNRHPAEKVLLVDNGTLKTLPENQ